MEANTRGFKGVWLCAAIYESREISAVEKLLLAEIDSLTTESDACYATNAHFADRLGVTITTADHLLGKLTRLGYIVRVSFDGRVTRRVVAPKYSSNPGHAIAIIGNAQKQSSTVKNNRAALPKNAEVDCQKPPSRTVKNDRAGLREPTGQDCQKQQSRYIREIPIEIPKEKSRSPLAPEAREVAEATGLAFAFPRSLDCEEFLKAWGKWEAYRKAKRKPISSRAREECLRACEQWGVAQAVAAISYSIRNDYQGLCEPRQPGKSDRALNGLAKKPSETEAWGAREGKSVW